jgi:hypothetical protein
MARLQHLLIDKLQIIKVRLGDIQQQDSFCRDFLASQDYESDHSRAQEMWSPEILEISALTSPPIIVKRKSGYQHLGSGLKLHLLQQIYDPDTEVFALLYLPKTISNKFKLGILASELLHAPSIYRTKRWRPRRNMVLWGAIVQEGGAPIFGEGARAFAHATGYSYNALVPPSKKPPKKPASHTPGIKGQDEVPA